MRLSSKSSPLHPSYQARKLKLKPPRNLKHKLDPKLPCQLPHQLPQLFRHSRYSIPSNKLQYHSNPSPSHKHPATSLISATLAAWHPSSPHNTKHLL